MISNVGTLDGIHVASRFNFSHIHKASYVKVQTSHELVPAGSICGYNVWRKSSQLVKLEDIVHHAQLSLPQVNELSHFAVLNSFIEDLLKLCPRQSIDVTGLLYHTPPVAGVFIDYKDRARNLIWSEI